MNIAFALLLKREEHDKESYFVDTLFEKSVKTLKSLNESLNMDLAAANYHRGRYLIESLDTKNFSKIDQNRLMLSKECLTNALDFFKQQNKHVDSCRTLL